MPKKHVGHKGIVNIAEGGYTHAPITEEAALRRAAPAKTFLCQLCTRFPSKLLTTMGHAVSHHVIVQTLLQHTPPRVGTAGLPALATCACVRSLAALVDALHMPLC